MDVEISQIQGSLLVEAIKSEASFSLEIKWGTGLNRAGAMAGYVAKADLIVAVDVDDIHIERQTVVFIELLCIVVSSG